MEDAWRKLPEINEESFTMENLWRALSAMQGKTFYTAKGLEFRYLIKGYEIFVDRKIKSKSITRSSVELVFKKLLERVREGEKFPLPVTGPKKLGVFGASYLYPVLMEMEIIRKG